MTDINTEIVNLLIKEKRTDRIWRNIRFGAVAFLLLLFLAIIVVSTRPETDDELQIDTTLPYAAVVSLEGDVEAGKSFSSHRAIPLIKRAFEDKKAKAVVLLINSPGGSPVHAADIYHEIRYLKKNNPNTRVIVVGEDMLTSAAYLVASAADEIYVNPNTVAGSIGVVNSGFGFNKLLDKIGVDRRVITAGTNKARMDPYKPLNETDKLKMERVLAEVHKNFVSDVKAGRGNRLKGNPEQLFSGDFWTGKEAVNLGLVDGLGSFETILRKIGVKQYRLYSEKSSMVSQILRHLDEKVSVKIDAMTTQKISAKF